MRLLHTADWHLGKTLKGQSLIDDQKFILDEIFDIIDERKPDALLIAGDIYDRGVPPIEAVNLFDATLNKLAERNLPTLIIAGNHDSATRLNFGSKLFARQNIFIAAKISDEPAQVVLEDEFGEVYFSLIPYFIPSDIRDNFSFEGDANRFYIDKARQKIPTGKRSVAVAHLFLTGGKESDSERKFVGGAENVDAQIFDGYNYVALGHLHRSQKISAQNIRYAGSPLKYSFDEANHKKSVTLVELDKGGAVQIEKIPLKPLHEVKIVEGKFHELKNLPTVRDYTQIILTDEAYIYETEKLRDAFPNFLEVKRKSHLHSYDDEPANSFNKEDSLAEQFADFFYLVMQEPLNTDERTAFEKFLHELDGEDREVST